MILLWGCRKGRDYEPSITPEDIQKGTDGLIVEFLPNSPPDDVFEQSIMPIGLNLKNKGAYDIRNGYLAISLEKTYMDINDYSLVSTGRRVDFTDTEHIRFDLNGKTVENPNGDEDVLSFTVETKKLEEQSQLHTSSILVTSCYVYQTELSETVCVDTDVFNVKKRVKSCEVKDITLSSQGSPLAITMIEPKMMPGEYGIKPTFIIHVENSGNGQVVDKDYLREACYASSLDYSKWNIAVITAHLSGEEEANMLDCNLETDENDAGIVKLREGRDKVKCVGEEIDESKGTYSAPLFIQVEYGYTTTVSKETKINKMIT